MKHLPAHVRDKVARQMERKERLTPEEWEAEKVRGFDMEKTDDIPGAHDVSNEHHHSQTDNRKAETH
eukprot:3617-Eustigmatos_ZCMA.PRE.1